MKIVLLLSLFAGLGWAQYTGGGVFPPGAVGGVSGASSTAQLTDLTWARSLATLMTLTIPTGGSNVTCNGTKTNIAAGTKTITLAASSAAASSTFYTYYDCASKTIKADTTATVTQGNVTLSGITFGSAAAVGYPANNIFQIARLTAGNSAVDQWDTGAVPSDVAYFNANAIPVSDTGIIVTPGTNGVGPKVAADTSLIPQKYILTAAPGSIAGNLPGDLAIDTNNHKFYRCDAPIATPSPACTSVSVGGWTEVGSGGTQILFVGGKAVNCDAGVAVVGAPWSGGSAISGSNAFCGTGFAGIRKFLPSGTDDLYLEFTWPSGVTNLDVLLMYTMDGSPSGNVKYSAQLGCRTAASGNFTPSYNAFSSVTTSVSTTAITQTSITNLDRTGCNTNDAAFIHLIRDNTVGSNNASSAYLGRGTAAITRPLP